MTIGMVNLNVLHPKRLEILSRLFDNIFVVIKTDNRTFFTHEMSY